MSREARQSLETQADRAERIAERTGDESLKEIVRQAAKDYRQQAGHEHD